MPEADQQTSIYEEMRSRRARSELLNGLAAEQGVPVHEVALCIPVDDEPEIEMKPAFDESEFESNAAVSESVLQEPTAEEPESLSSDLEMDTDAVSSDLDETPEFAEAVEPESSIVPEDQETEIAAEPEPLFGAEEIEPEPESENVAIENQSSDLEAEPQGDIDTPFEEVEQVAEEDSEPEPEPAAPFVESVVEEKVPEPVAEAAPEVEESVEDENDVDESFLGEDPSEIIDAEVNRVAEELVDRIGPVVDIQNLPKTQPSRVLSKTAKAENKSAPESKAPPVQNETQPAEDDFPEFVDSISESMQPKEEPKPEAVEENSKPKRKKKVSLLDSYFKGL